MQGEEQHPNETPSHEGSDSKYPLTGNGADAGPEVISPGTDASVEPLSPEPIVPDNQSDEIIGTKPSRRQRFKRWYGSHKKLAVPATILLFLLVIAAIPWSRYQAAGFVMKQDLSMQVVDSKTGSPVSGALVTIGPVSGTTDGSGDATLHSVKVGYRTATITKKYYQDQQIKVTVPILSSKEKAKVSIVATGRQVKIGVKDLISAKALGGVEIKIADVEAKTGDDGTATVVVPADSTSEDATLNLNGYNESRVKVEVSADSVRENDFKLTPAGKVYFLSNLTGKIDVVKTNLDGTGRHTVLAGTGKEDKDTTVLLASKDWKYVALLASRDSADAKLYIINTANDQLSVIDQGSNVSFSPIGWSDHYFVYSLTHNDYNNWQPNATSIKSYNAENGQQLTLVNSKATGTSDADAEYESIFDTVLMGNNLIYTKTWYQPSGLDVTGKQNTLAAIHPDGSGSRQLKLVDSGTKYISSLKLNKPDQLYFGVYSNDYTDSSYFSLDGNGNVKTVSGISDRDLMSAATTFFSSPSGDSTFWSEIRDGKNTLFTGDQSAGGAKQIATLSSLAAYGWYTDNYLLVSKSSSELYIIPKSGIAKDSDAIKISDYYKPSNDFYYGGY